MIVEKCYSGSTLIKFDDRDINTKEENKAINTLLYTISKKFQNNIK